MRSGSGGQDGAFLLAEATRSGNHHHDPKEYASSSYSTSTSTLSYAPPLSPSSSASPSLSYASTYTTRPNIPTTMTTTTTTNLHILATFTTYPLPLPESYFNVLVGQLMLGDFTALLPSFLQTALVDGLEGYPVFLPPRLVGQAECVEVLERLASGWRHGAGSTGGRGKEAQAQALSCKIENHWMRLLSFAMKFAT